MRKTIIPWIAIPFASAFAEGLIGPQVLRKGDVWKYRHHFYSVELTREPWEFQIFSMSHEEVRIAEVTGDDPDRAVTARYRNSSCTDSLLHSVYHPEEDSWRPATAKAADSTTSCGETGLPIIRLHQSMEQAILCQNYFNCSYLQTASLELGDCKLRMGGFGYRLDWWKDTSWIFSKEFGKDPFKKQTRDSLIYVSGTYQGKRYYYSFIRFSFYESDPPMSDRGVLEETLWMDSLGLLSRIVRNLNAFHYGGLKESTHYLESLNGQNLEYVREQILEDLRATHGITPFKPAQTGDRYRDCPLADAGPDSIPGPIGPGLIPATPSATPDGSRRERGYSANGRRIEPGRAGSRFPVFRRRDPSPGVR